MMHRWGILRARRLPNSKGVGGGGFVFTRANEREKIKVYARNGKVKWRSIIYDSNWASHLAKLSFSKLEILEVWNSFWATPSN